MPTSARPGPAPRGPSRRSVRGTVNDMCASAPSSSGSSWMIMSTLMFASASAVKIRPATPGWSGTPSSVIRASSRECVTAVIRGRSIVSSSPTTKVPGASVNEDRQWIRTPWLRAYSTERNCSTPAPDADISSISSKETTGSLRASGHDPRVGAVDAGHVGVDLAHLGVHRGGQRDRGGVRAAAAERRDVAGGGHALEAGHEHDQVVVERGADAVRADVEDPRLGVAGVGHDPGLGAGEADRVVAQVVDRHRAQRARDPLAGRQQHVHLARIGRGRDLFGHRDQLVGGLPARGEHRDDAMALLAGGNDAPRGALDALRVGHGGAAELHHHGAGHGGQSRSCRIRLRRARATLDPPEG